MMCKTIIFDLDDTLYKEIDFLKSAYQEIAEICDDKDEDLFNDMIGWYHNDKNVFEKLVERYPHVTIRELIQRYRNHKPNIKLSREVKQVLDFFRTEGCNIGLMTDGRSITQRNKLRALGIEDFFDAILISEEFGSEKPSKDNFIFFEKKFDGAFAYIGDNTAKDFITPNKLGWSTICLLSNGSNIHPQNFTLSEIFLPDYKINRLNEVIEIISKR